MEIAKIEFIKMDLIHLFFWLMIMALDPWVWSTVSSYSPLLSVEIQNKASGDSAGMNNLGDEVENIPISLSYYAAKSLIRLPKPGLIHCKLRNVIYPIPVAARGIKE